MSTPGWTVYFVRRGDVIKTGRTQRHVEARVAELTLQGWPPEAGYGPLEILATMSGDSSLERDVLSRFKDLRYGGSEYLRVDPDLLSYIELVKRDPIEAAGSIHPLRLLDEESDRVFDAAVARVNFTPVLLTGDECLMSEDDWLGELFAIACAEAVRNVCEWFQVDGEPVVDMDSIAMDLMLYRTVRQARSDWQNFTSSDPIYRQSAVLA